MQKYILNSKLIFLNFRIVLSIPHPFLYNKKLIDETNDEDYINILQVIFISSTFIQNFKHLK